MSRHKTHRVNLTLKGETSTKFLDLLQGLRKKEIEEGRLNLTSASELARDLVEKALSLEAIEGVFFEGKSVNYQESRNRFNITFYPSDLEKLKEHNIDIGKGTKLNVTIHKTQNIKSNNVK